jgi:hypothetical protein
MQVPFSVFKYNIDESSKSLFEGDDYKNYLKNIVVLSECEEFDENFYRGVIYNQPEKSKFNLLDKVYYSRKSILYKIEKEKLEGYNHDLNYVGMNRIFKTLEEGKYLKNNINFLKLQKLTSIIFELSIIDLEFLYTEFASNPHKKTKEHKLRQILIDLSNQSLSSTSSIPLLIDIIKKIYIKINIKKRMKEGRLNISNEQINKVLNLLDEYNSTKRSYKQLELFKKRLDEEQIPYDFFLRLLKFQGTLTGRFNTMIKL